MFLVQVCFLEKIHTALGCQIAEQNERLFENVSILQKNNSETIVMYFPC